jgi:hypothetical protein
MRWRTKMTINQEKWPKVSNFSNSFSEAHLLSLDITYYHIIQPQSQSHTHTWTTSVEFWSLSLSLFLFEFVFRVFGFDVQNAKISSRVTQLNKHSQISHLQHPPLKYLIQQKKVLLHVSFHISLKHFIQHSDVPFLWLISLNNSTGNFTTSQEKMNKRTCKYYKIQFTLVVSIYKYITGKFFHSLIQCLLRSEEVWVMSDLLWREERG